jgi:hypothetical protein
MSDAGRGLLQMVFMRFRSHPLFLLMGGEDFIKYFLDQLISLSVDLVD